MKKIKKSYVIVAAALLCGMDAQAAETGQTEYRQSEGKRIQEFTEEYQGLPDNDMARLPLTIERNGLEYALIEAEIVPIELDEEGVPTEYTAKCTYGALESYSVSYPVKKPVQKPEKEPEKPERNVTETETIEAAVIEAMPEEEDKIETIYVPVSEKKIPQKDTSWLPMAAAGAGGVLLAACFWFFHSRVPVYSRMVNGNDWKKVGTVRIRKRGGVWAVRIPEGVYNRSDTSECKLVLKERTYRKIREAECNVLEIKTPSGKQDQPVTSKIVHFSM